MNSVKTSVNAMIAVTKGEVDQKDRLPELAATFVAATNSAMTTGAFKQNTDGQGSEKTTATPMVWEEWGSIELAYSGRILTGASGHFYALTGFKIFRHLHRDTGIKLRGFSAARCTATFRRRISIHNFQFYKLR